MRQICLLVRPKLLLANKTNKNRIHNDNLKLRPFFEEISMNNVHYEQGIRNGSNLVIRMPGPNWLSGLNII